jgi:hypothetical protein
MEFKDTNQFRSFMKKEAIRLNISVPNTYNTYFARSLLQRIALIEMYEQNISPIYVKGSFSQFIYLQKLIRPVTDVDLSSKEDIEDSLWPLIKKINATDSPLTFKLRREPHITETGMYKIMLEAHLNGINQPISIDFHEKNKALYEDQLKPVMPIFKGDKKFYVDTPSFEEHLAEKLCIICESNKPDVINTRVKDFYDIYEMHGNGYDFDKFSYYFARMLNDRGKINPSVASTSHLTPEFVSSHQATWDKMKIKYEFLFPDENNIPFKEDVPFSEAVYYSKGVLSEQLQKMKTNSRVLKKS